ncbi:zinc finger BED domain-containing protein RICESLEEPER 2-like [Triticum dicoccoides]|uniref:zinc finger BED domain-containing protein RICESLEEPER 2-like n=1 Tax=Triticum dicoccoides TaxID=85692 RepID=UPI000E7CBED1|nr:zinc finger BED domain-containing protein RICESLEEPER 2-like [Triticum dicoccoides]
MDQERDGPNPSPSSKEEVEILTGMEDEVDSANDMVEQEESTGSAPSPSFSGRNTKRLQSKGWDDFMPIFVGTKLAKAECMHCQKVYNVGSSGTSNLLKHQAKCSARAHKRPMQDKLQMLPSTQKSTVAASPGLTQKKLPFSLASQKKCLSTADAMLQKKGLALLDIPNDMNQEVHQNSSHEELAGREQKNQLGAKLAVPEQDILTNMNRKNPEVDQGEPHKELVRIFAAHGQSPFIRAHDRFSKFVACLNPMVKMPDEYVMCRYFKELFDKEKTNLKEKLAALGSRVCLSAYVWHYDLLSAFLCLSVHYIDGQWEKQKNIIKFRAVDPSCSGEELSQSILYAIDDWGLRDKVFSIILDDAFLDDSVTSDVKARLEKWNLLSANRSVSTSVNQSLFVIRYATHLVKHVIQVGKDELEKVTQKSTKCSKYTKGHIPPVVHYPNHRYAPSPGGWKSAKKICKVMEDLQRHMDEIHNCCNPADLFDKVWDVKKLLHRDADSYIWGDSKISKELEKMQEKSKEQWKLCCLNICMPMIMDPSYRLKRIKSRLRSDAGNYHLEKRSFEDDIEDYIEEVHAILLNLFCEYSDQVEDTSCTSGSKTRKRTLGEGRDTLMDYYQAAEYPYSERPMIELDQYMQEPGLSADESSVLQWWKEHNLTYPTIARMARDILAVPLSVDCSVAIKTARRTICESSSLWREEVVCVQDWLRSDGSSSE